MTAVLDQTDATLRVGKFEFYIAADDRTPEVEQRGARRSEAIAALLLAEWRRDQRQRMATDTDDHCQPLTAKQATERS